MIAYRLPHLPDLRTLRHRQRPSAREESGTAVFAFASYLTQLLPAESVAVTLRYDYDPNRRGPNRLRLYLLISPANDHEGKARTELSEHREDIDAALSALRQAWGTEVDLEEVKLDEFERGFSALAHLRLRDRIDYIDRADKEKLEPAYRLSSWGDSLQRNWQAQRWDALFDTLMEPVMLDIALMRMNWDVPDARGYSLANHLYEEIRILSGKVSSRGNQAIGKPREEASREKRSLGAERLRKAWNDWLDELHQGTVYRFNLRVLARSPEISNRVANRIALQLMPDSILEVRLLQRPDKVKKAVEGSFTLFYQRERKSYSRRLGGESPERWRELSQLRNSVPAAVARELMRLPLPQAGHLKTLWLDTERMNAGGDEPVIDLGVEPDRPVPAQFPLSQLNKHLFVAGVTGSGKTTTLVEILCQLAERGIPFLVIEPSKREYRGLVGHPALRDRLRVYTCGDDDLSPLKLNPFVFDHERVHLDEHLSMLEACFKGALPLFSPLSEILVATLRKAYQSPGRDQAGPVSPVRFPCMRDLTTALDPVLQEFQYSDRIALDLHTAARVRLASLTQGAVGRVFDSTVALPPVEELMAHPTLIELDKLSQEHANLVTLFLLQAINQHLHNNPGKDGLRHVLVIEEAHNIVGTHGRVSGGENSADPRAEAANFMVRMLAEVRKLGMGIVIADQTPAAVAPEVLKNTGIKAVHRTVSGDDRDSLAESMLLDSAQSDELARLGRGECFLYHEYLYWPQPVQVKLKASRVNGFEFRSLDDKSLDEWLENQTWHQKQCRARLEEWRAVFFDPNWQKQLAEYREVLEKAANSQPGLRRRHRRTAEARGRKLRDWLARELKPRGSRAMRRAIESLHDACLASLENMEADCPLPEVHRAVQGKGQLPDFLEVLDAEIRNRWERRVETLRHSLVQLDESLRKAGDLLPGGLDMSGLEELDDALRDIGDILYRKRWSELKEELEQDLGDHPKAHAYYLMRFDRQRERYETLSEALPRSPGDSGPA